MAMLLAAGAFKSETKLMPMVRSEQTDDEPDVKQTKLF
jgi:hypothetical protein